MVHTRVKADGRCDHTSVKILKSFLKRQQPYPKAFRFIKFYANCCDDSFQDLKYLHVLIRIFFKIERGDSKKLYNNGTIVTAQRPSQFRTS